MSHLYPPVLHSEIIRALLEIGLWPPLVFIQNISTLLQQKMAESESRVVMIAVDASAQADEAFECKLFHYFSCKILQTIQRVWHFVITTTSVCSVSREDTRRRERWLSGYLKSEPDIKWNNFWEISLYKIWQTLKFIITERYRTVLWSVDLWEVKCCTAQSGSTINCLLIHENCKFVSVKITYIRILIYSQINVNDRLY